MLGLAIIFGFLAWLILTLIAMWFCGRIAKNSGKSRRVGLFWGFMLVMGWHYLIWGIEYVRMYVIVAYQCQKSGIWVYVPPEEWKKMPKMDPTVNDEIIKPAINFEGKEYKFNFFSEDPSVYKKIGAFMYKNEIGLRKNILGGNGDIIYIKDIIYYEPLSKKVLYRIRSTYVGEDSDEILEYYYNIFKLMPFPPVCAHEVTSKARDLNNQFFSDKTE